MGKFDFRAFPPIASGKQSVDVLIPAGTPA